MTIEMFERGTNFKNHIRNFLYVIQIKHESGKYILTYAYDSKKSVLDADKVEFKISI